MKLAINHHATRIDKNSNYIFGREEFAVNLKNIFTNTDGGFVLAIDASWGEGKTSFTHQLIYDLKYSNNLIPIYYDAFSNDFSSDTFLSIGATISHEVEKHFQKKGLNNKNKIQITHLKSVTKKTAVELVKLGTNLAVRSLTAGVVGSSELEKFASDAFNSVTFDTLELDLNKKFEAYENSKTSIQSYVKALESVCSENEKVVFFIDELDRCRPNFAVEVLEKIKHLFLAKNVIFVISYNKLQLSKIISSVYGVDAEDSFKYLEKFIHIEAKLPMIDSKYQESSYKLLFNSFVDEFDIQLPSDEYLRNMFISLCSDKHLKMNSREIERAFSYVSFCFASLPQNDGLELFRFFLPAAMIKVKNRELFESVKGGSFNSLNGNNSQKWVYNFFDKYFSDYLEQKASNVYYVKAFEEACTIVSIFKLPADVE
ncbi:KAP family P-loop NTPase fold protein [Psychromonas arctica]|uniref:KAP family P-loop NTPase fold protein n=1 Tax=Psychromonas arctica TaxID=168275 RepID=UPI0003FE1E66|nr:P-loop NTPase fold protein [Psychromonas arctica]